MRITSRWLRRHYACWDQVTLFRQLYPAKKYPKGVLVTVAGLRRAARAGLDISWLMTNVPLSDKARVAYSNAIVPVREAFGKAISPTQNAYYESSFVERDAARDKYDAACAVAARAYDHAIAPAIYAALRSARR